MPLKTAAEKPAVTVSEKPWGVPGEEHQLWVLPVKRGEKLPARLGGEPGKYKVPTEFNLAMKPLLFGAAATT